MGTDLNSFYFVGLLFVVNLVHSYALPAVSRAKESLIESHYDQCHYQLKSGSNLLKMSGQCMSMAGPDGCCLNGHYEPGICPNLVHLCCINPDPDCSQMRNNKGLIRQRAKQQFKAFVQNNSDAKLQLSNSADHSLLHRRATRGVNFEIIEMPAHMQLVAVTVVNDSLERHPGDFDEAAYNLCKMLDQKYADQANWACVVGKSFDYSIEAASGKYMLFYIGNVNRIRVMAFVPKTSEEDR